MTEVRKATYADIEAISLALARAFEDDPVMAWLFPAVGNRLDRVRRLFTLDLRVRHLRHDESWMSPDCAGAALWAPPDQWKLDTSDIVRTLPTTVRLLGFRLPLALRGLRMIEHGHPAEPHYYLAVLGADPSRQGKGIGTALLQPVLDRCDAEGTGAYLESSKERNVPYYRRFGFEVTEEVTLPKGPPVWRMWRDPRSS